LPPLSREAYETLRPLVPAMASLRNPIDLTFFRNPDHYLEEIPRVLLQDKDVDMLLLYCLFPDHLAKAGLVDKGFSEIKAEKEVNKVFDIKSKSLAELLREYQKPIVGYTVSGIRGGFMQRLLECGVPVFPSPERAARAMAALAAYSESRQAARL
jgi:acyl-CoA synthetase (NDP forming)